MHSPFYELSASLGIRTLYSGHGGDETVINTGELALQELIGHRTKWLGNSPSRWVMHAHRHYVRHQ
jgi:hypothetical protein